MVEPTEEADGQGYKSSSGFSMSSMATVLLKGSFGCKTSDQIRTESPAEKDALPPNLARVYGFVKVRARAIWRI